MTLTNDFPELTALRFKVVIRSNRRKDYYHIRFLCIERTIYSIMRLSALRVALSLKIEFF